MNLNLKQIKNDLVFLPLGGAGEIGMNLNMYHYQGKWLIADLGAGFADDYLPGIDMIVPDISFIRAQRDNIVGIVITHAHEDHLGAVPYLWDEIECPVYTTGFTASVLKAKIAEFGLGKNLIIKEVQSNSKFNIDPFELELIQLTHSVPEMNAIAIRTDKGVVLHTGDWKFDPDPKIGPISNIDRLKAYGDEGLLAMVCDSTNIFSPGHSGSEGDLRKSLKEIISGCDGLVAVTTFASNVARIESIAEAAQENGRKVALVGRSLWRIVRAAQENGYLKDMEFLEDREISKYAKHKSLIICTGCQGEPLAATNKIAHGIHPVIKLTPKDTVIFSSKIIPGNEKRIFYLFNKFARSDIKVLTEKDHFVHVSGHPSRDELADMYRLARPLIAVPVHGETVHMGEHKEFSLSHGAKYSIRPENGMAIKLSEKGPEVVGYVQAGYLAIDGNYLIPPDGAVLKLRRRMKQSGIITATLIFSSKGHLRVDPIIMAPGALDEIEDKAVIAMIVDEIYDAIEGKEKLSDDKIAQFVKSAIKRVMKREVGKEPTSLVHIERLS